MHENEANELHQRLLELEERNKMILQQLQERIQQVQENDQQIKERDQQIQDYYRSKQLTTFCEYVEGCHDTLCYELAF
ncbi:hypothetical protein E4U61_002756 [Claviceps capensis]|nr:hypothetical protein E4U61_002756 [Claviceps capensis]